jgi:glycosyltransferase involved in cell wall biosynthesis
LIRPLNIFIAHASDLLTDCEAHGDGLVADYFIRNLMARGHTLHVAVNKCVLREKYAENVKLHFIDTGVNQESAVSRLRFMLGMRSTFAKLSRGCHFDVIHQLNPVVTGLSLALWRTDVPIVLGPHVPAWPRIDSQGKLEKRSAKDRLKTRVKMEMWQLQHRIASGIIVSTPAALEKMREPSAFESKTHVIPIGINTAAFTPSPLPDTKSILLINPSRHKGVFVLLEAFRSVLREIPDCKLVLAGKSPELDKVKQVASQLGILPNVVFRGAYKRDEVPTIMRECTVFCVPSFGEPFGQVTLEAMACGRPVVGTDAGGSRYLINERGGRKVAVGDADALAQSLIEVLENPVLARAMGAHNRHIAETEYAWPAVIAKVEHAYFAAIDAKRMQRHSATTDPRFQSGPTIA